MLFSRMQLRSIVSILFVVSISLGSLLALPPQSSGTAGSIDGKVADQTGAVVSGAEVKLQHPASGFSQTTTTDSSGQFHFRNLPFNNYHLSVSASKFTPQATDVDIRSALPVSQSITLGVASAETVVNVEAGGEDLIENDPNYHTDVDRDLFDKLPLESQSSSVSSLVTLATPGVVADSNGLFHAMGEHADNSFSVDGQPISDQQSKVFSNQIPVDSIQALEVISGAPPAEYGDKTSLVIKVTTRSGLGQTRPTGSIWGDYGLEADSARHQFRTGSGGFNLAVGNQKFGNFVTVSGLNTGRFLDPPEFQVLHAAGNEENAFDRIDGQFSNADAFHVNLGFTRSWFQTPNSFDTEFSIVPSLPGTLLRQDQRSQIKTYNVAPSWTHLFNNTTLFSLGAFYRQDQYGYFPSRNVLADQPQTINQRRRLANAGVRSDLSYVKGVHNLKIGVTYQHTLLTENFGFGITDSTLNSPCLNADGTSSPDITFSDSAQCAGDLSPNPAFQPVLLPNDLTRGGRNFLFHGHADIRELALYLQDAITVGPWAFNLGVRGDVYRGITRDAQPEPRLGVAYNVKKTNTVLRVSYGRMLETPFNENLVLASLANGNPVISAVIGPSITAPIRPGYRNEFHAGFQQALGKYLVVDADYMWKYTRNGYDFSVFGLTPITFPIQWHNSKIGGPSARISLPNFHGLTAFTVIGSVYARFFPPQTGGLGTTATAVGGRPFRIDHDQAFQQTTHVQYQPWKLGPWFAFNWRYDSGLVAGRVPVATDQVTPVDLTVLTADQQIQAGLHCGGIFPTLTSPLTTCAPGAYGSTRIKLPFPGTVDPDHNPQRIAPRHLVDVAIGHDNLFHGEHYRLSARVTVVNIANKVALYNFLSTFSGTHFVTPRTVSGELGFHF